MPYFITENHPDCSGWAVVDDGDGYYGCHTTKQSAIDQAVAISISDEEPFEGERKADGDPIIICDIDGTLLNGKTLIQKTWDYVQSLEGALFIVTGRPESQRDSTAKDLADAGVIYSRLIMNTSSTADSVAYKKATAENLLETYNVLVAVENNPDALRAYSSLGIEAVNPADLPESRKQIRAAIGSLSIGDYVSWNPLDPKILAEIVMVEGEYAVVRIYEFEDGIFSETEKLMILNIFKLERINRPEFVAEEIGHTENPDTPTDNIEPMDTNRDRWVRAAWAIKSKLEDGTNEARSLGKTELRTNHLELRAVGDGMTFEGYAAVFNSPSEPLPFVELIKPGAFARSLKSRNRMMLLWNHNTSEPLASTRNGSLRLVEDEVGLKVTATLADTTTGNNVAELVRSGVVDSMSFGFVVKKDSWSGDGQTRTLEEVALHEVSLVSFPAYEGTAGKMSIREVRDINPEQLADALLKLESGEELDNEQALLITEVVGKLQKTEEVQAVDGDILALKQKKLSLLMKEAI